MERDEIRKQLVVAELGLAGRARRGSRRNWQPKGGARARDAQRRGRERVRRVAQRRGFRGASGAAAAAATAAAAAAHLVKVWRHDGAAAARRVAQRADRGG